MADCSDPEPDCFFNEFDCNNVCGGAALIDNCGICSEGNTGLVANADQDCNGDCFGEAFVDDCGVCSEGLSNHTANSYL